MNDSRVWFADMPHLYHEKLKTPVLFYIVLLAFTLKCSVPGFLLFFIISSWFFVHWFWMFDLGVRLPDMFHYQLPSNLYHEKLKTPVLFNIVLAFTISLLMFFHTKLLFYLLQVWLLRIFEALIRCFKYLHFIS